MEKSESVAKAEILEPSIGHAPTSTDHFGIAEVGEMEDLRHMSKGTAAARDQLTELRETDFDWVPYDQTLRLVLSRMSVQKIYIFGSIGGESSVGTYVKSTCLIGFSVSLGVSSPSTKFR